MFYLKYRPKKISELDNSQVASQLKKILEADELPHALLFIGQKGTGKTSSARIFAKALNCLNNKFSQKNQEFEPCNHCQNCLAIDNGTSPDVVEMDAASNRGIDDVKKITQETSLLPMTGNYRIFIIDEVHMITNEGFNALLKTLEEPPKTAIFILATTNPEKLPKTIVSRCLKINFGKAKKPDIIRMLERIAKSENLQYHSQFYSLIAEHSDNSFRDAAKILEEVVLQKINSLEELEKYLGIRGKNNLLAIIEEKNQQKTFAWIDEFSQNNGNFKNLIEDLLNKLHLQLLIKKGIKQEDEKEINLSVKEIAKLIKLLMEAYQLQKLTPIDSLPLEIALTEFYNENS
ncbi:MAG: DNA polymerase III subunit gamma/tau [Microgenomates group bacterium]